MDHGVSLMKDPSLPWYLSRHFPNYHWDGKEAMDPSTAAVLILSRAADEMLQHPLAGAGQDQAFAEKFVGNQFSLHPSGTLRIYVEKNLWERFVAGEPRFQTKLFPDIRMEAPPEPVDPEIPKHWYPELKREG